MSDEGSEQEQDLTKQAIAKARADKQATGKAWQTKDVDRVEEALETEGGMQALAGKAVSDAFTGQRAADMVEAPAFDAPSTSILDQPVLVVYQEAKFVELADEYHYALADGTELGMGRQTNQGVGRKLLRMATNLDSKMKSVVEVTQDGAPVFTMERKGSIGKNTMVITDGSGAEVGEVKQTKRGSRRATFELVAAGQALASMQAGHARAGQGYDIVASDGTVVAYVRRLHEGAFKQIGRGRFSEPDNYVLRMATRLEDPLRTLVVATPMSVDSAVSQDRDGMELGDVKRLIRRVTR